MPFIDGQQQSVLLERLSFVQHISPSDIELLKGLSWEFADLPAGHEFVRTGSQPSRSCLVIEGVTCRFTELAKGERQIQALHIPGDMPDLMSLHLRTMDHSLGTISACRLAYVKHEELKRICEQSLTLNTALWRETLIDAALYRASILRLGELAAVERVAHLICEMKSRFEAIGRVHNLNFTLPLTQENIGEILGITVVTVNRCLQELRHNEIVRNERGAISILNWEQLVKIGQFDPTYLHLNDA